MEMNNYLKFIETATILLVIAWKAYLMPNITNPRWFTSYRQNANNDYSIVSCLRNQQPTKIFNVSSKLQCILSCFSIAEFSCFKGNYFANNGRCEIFQFWNATYEPLLLNFADDCQGFEKKGLCPFNYTFLPEEKECIRWFTEIGLVSWDVANSQYCTAQGPSYHLLFVKTARKGKSVANLFNELCPKIKIGSFNCSVLRKSVWTAGYRFNDSITYWRYANNVKEKFGPTLPWNFGEPTYYNGNIPENCIELLEDGMLNDMSCAAVDSFFCETDANIW